MHLDVFQLLGMCVAILTVSEILSGNVTGF